MTVSDPSPTATSPTRTIVSLGWNSRDASLNGRLIVVTDDTPGDRSAVFTRHGVAAQIVYGGIIEISERPYGSLTYAITGDDAAVDAAIAELAASGGVEEHDLEGLR